MSNFFLSDRIKETSRTVGTGSLVLDGPVPGFSSFKDFYASGDVVFYAVTDNIKYEIGSGIYKQSGSSRVLTRFPFRSSNINVGPWYVNATSNSGPTAGQSGYFHPMWLSRSAAESGIGFSTGPFSGIMEHTFSEIPGIIFYMCSQHQGHAHSNHASISGSNFYDISNLSNSSGTPVSFQTGLKEVFVTYPGKTSVYNGFGLDSSISSPKDSGIAFWKNEQILNYSPDIVWDDNNNFLGIGKSNPSYAVDVGGLRSNAIVRASGFIEGGSGILFSGGQQTYTLRTASGGVQLEPFLRNQIGNGSNGIISLSGLVDQFIGFSKQAPATILAGPISGWCGSPPCQPDFPTFRTLAVSDLPAASEWQDEFGFIIQDNLGLDNVSANITPNNFVPGMVLLYKASGSITADSGIFFDAINNRLLVAGNASSENPSYTIDVRGEGTIKSPSGYFNQLIFADDIVRIGNTANNTNLGNLSNNFYIISIGKNTSNASSGLYDAVGIGHSSLSNAQSGSGLIALGTNSLRSSVQNNHIFSVGENAGLNSAGNNNLIFLGANAGTSSSGIANSIAIGAGSLNTSKNLNNTIVLGPLAGSGLENVQYSVIGFGKNVLSNASGVDNTIAIGPFAMFDAKNSSETIAIGNESARYTQASSRSIFIGSNAGLSGSPINNTVAIGRNAAFLASGNHNIYIGHNAGSSLSGNQNIEIVTSGMALSFIGYQDSGKINIANTIAGDTFNSKIGIGALDNINPSATLYIRPKNNNDHSFVIHGKSQTVSPFLIQSNDGTTYYQITNSGSVITSGYISPSGGVFLPHNNAPMLNSGVGGYMLWNNNGTLVWNGSSVGAGSISGSGGSFSSWLLTNGRVAADAITDGQTVTISGISGVEVQYNPTTNFVTISASGLSGVLQNQITAQTYNFYTLASGYGSNNNSLDLRSAGSVVALSGVSGVKIDYLNLDSGSNSSGVFIIGYDNSNTYTFDISNGSFNKTVLNNEKVTVSGVSGVEVALDSTNRFFRIGASGLSGVLNSTIQNSGNSVLQVVQNSGNYLRGQILQNTASGLAISGIAAYASGLVTGFTALSATSGVKLENNRYIIDPAGSGRINQLTVANDFRLDSQKVTLGFDSLSQSVRSDNLLAIGSSAGARASGINNSTCIGNFSALGASGIYDSVVIGRTAAFMSKGLWSNISIGQGAGSLISALSGVENNEYFCLNNIFIGPDAGNGSLANRGCIFIGDKAGANTSSNDRSIILRNDPAGSPSILASNIQAKTDVKDLLWAGDGVSFCLDIAKSIQGIADPTGATIHIGRRLDVLNSGIDINSIRDASLNITPKTSTKNAIKLILSPDNQQASMLVSEWKDGGGKNTGLNSIINNNGLLRVPVAVSKTGSGTTTRLFTDTDEIVAGQGVVCVYEFSPTDKGLAICVSVNHNNFAPWQWVKLATTTPF